MYPKWEGFHLGTFQPAFLLRACPKIPSRLTVPATHVWEGDVGNRAAAPPPRNARSSSSQKNIMTAVLSLLNELNEESLHHSIPSCVCVDACVPVCVRAWFERACVRASVSVSVLRCVVFVCV